MHYTTKARSKKLDREYLVIRHPLRLTGNTWLMGIKFCNGVGIVEKGSKVHRSLNKSPILKKRKEYGLDYLPKLGFRTKDISLIWGKDVYWHYLDSIGLNADLTRKEEIKEEPKVVAFEPKDIEEIKEELREEFEDESEEVLEEMAEEIVEDKSDEIEIEEEIPELTPEEIIAAHKEMSLCIHQKEDGNICKNRVSKGSISGNYCFGHIKRDPEYIKKNK